MSPDPTGSEAWLEVLTAMEDAVAEVEQGPGTGPAATPAAGWTPPVGIGPIPADLRERAGALVAAQESAMVRLRAAQRTNRSHSAVLRALPHRPGTASIYLDVEG
ncbi:hypothetical protein [Georgenia sp. AZ-5]|uniref:hypothetical protein n=1 Tax=Georgenia sp. AZ-5 TaxID=3367526 RepID=UPI003754F402